MTSLPAPLVRLIAQFESATAEANALAASTTEAAFTRRAGNRWSAADCLNHLSTTNERYLGRLDRTIAAARARSREPRYRPSLVGRLFKSLMEPPVRKRLRAPKIFIPSTEPTTREAAVSRFVATNSRIVDMIRAAAPLDFAAIRISSPVTRLLKINLWDTFQIMAAHERRHLWQAQVAAETLSERPDRIR